MLYIRQCIGTYNLGSFPSHSQMYSKQLERERYLRQGFGEFCIQNYSCYIAKLRQKYASVVTTPNLNISMLHDIFDEIELYQIARMHTFSAAKKNHLLVLGYFRGCISANKYNDDIGRLLLQYAYLDIVKEDEQKVTLDRKMWDEDSWSYQEKAAVLQKAAEDEDWTFITKWLLTCMERAQIYGQDYSSYLSIFTQVQRIHICLHGDNFLNTKLLRWLWKKWHLTSNFLDSYSDFSIFSLAQRSYLEIWIEEGEVTWKAIEPIVCGAFDNETINTFEFLLVLALHQLLKKECFPLKYREDYSFIDKQVLRINPKKNFQTTFYRAYISHLLTRQERKQILANLLNYKHLSVDEKIAYLSHCYFSKDEIHFFSIIIEILLDNNHFSKAVEALEKHKYPGEVLGKLSKAYQIAIDEYINRDMPSLGCIDDNPSRLASICPAISSNSLAKLGISASIGLINLAIFALFDNWAKHVR